MMTLTIKRQARIVLAMGLVIIMNLGYYMTVKADYSPEFYNDPAWIAAGKEFMNTNDEALKKPIFIAQDSSDPMSAVAIEKLQRLMMINDEFVEKCTWSEAGAYQDVEDGYERGLKNYFAYTDYDWKTKDGQLVLDHNARIYPVIKYFDSRLNDGVADYDLKHWVAQFNNQNEIAAGWTDFVPEMKLNLDMPYAYGIAAQASSIKYEEQPIIIGKGEPCNVQFGPYVSAYSVTMTFQGSEEMFNEPFKLYFDQNNRLLNIVRLDDWSQELVIPVFVWKLSYQAEKCGKGQRFYVG